MIQYVFMAIGFLVTILNLLVFLALRRRMIIAFPRRGGLISFILAAPFWLLLHPAILLMFGGASVLMVLRNDAPLALQLSSMSFQMAVWIYGGILLLAGTPGTFAGAARRLRRLFNKHPDGTRPEKDLAVDERRRNLVKAGLVMPAAIVATAAGGTLAARQAPVVNRIRLRVPKDRTNLHGLTIAQVSDVHVGSYMDRERLRMISDVMNSLKADYHVMTGDLLDNDMIQLEHSQDFLRDLSPRREVLMCMGNHEYIAARTGDVKDVVNGLRETGAQLLIDDARKLSVGGDHLWVGGIDYPAQAGLPGSRRTPHDSLSHTLALMDDDGAPRIVLAHHPKSFAAGKDMQLDLMLSGHTHGGQLKLGRIGDFAITPVLPFEFFHNGHYERNGRRLYVNAGAGGWMPVRINCPPEITIIELV
ncbi:MAG: metallophosphoesterase [Planctomycetes bacterium]|nr:metallophosphoesterase [Planctomycetota bacterium]